VSLVPPGPGGRLPSTDWRGTLWTLLVTFCIVTIRLTETFWSSCTYSFYLVKIININISFYNFICLEDWLLLMVGSGRNILLSWEYIVDLDLYCWTSNSVTCVTIVWVSLSVIKFLMSDNQFVKWNFNKHKQTLNMNMRMVTCGILHSREGKILKHLFSLICYKPENKFMFNVLLTVRHRISVYWNQRVEPFIQFIENQGPLYVHVSSITCSASGGTTQTALGILRAWVSWLCHDCIAIVAQPTDVIGT
jgi:hypothetical protein